MIKENTEINKDLKKILVKKHKLKVSTAYLYFKNYKEKYDKYQ